MTSAGHRPEGAPARAFVMRTATCTVFQGRDVASGALLSGVVLAERVGWLADIVAQIGQQVLDAHWNAADITALTAKTLPDGRRMPQFAYKAVSALFGWAKAPARVYASSRVVWMGTELAGRQLRSASYRMVAVGEVVRGVIQGEAATDAVTWRNTRRQVGAFRDANGRLPTDLFDLAPAAPRVPRQVILAGSDTQFSRHDRSTPGTVGVELRLPLVPQPASAAQWALVRMDVTIPDRYGGGAVKAVTLRPGTDRVRVDVPVDMPVAAPSGVDGRVFGLDWGVRRLLTGSFAHRVAGRNVHVDGRPLFFNANGLMAKVHRLREHREKVRGRAARIALLLEGRSDPVLQARHDHLVREGDRCDRKQVALSAQVAGLAAAWAVNQALAAGASVIAVEDLRSLEHRGHGRRNNVNTSMALHGAVQDALTNAAALVGVRVVEVPARGTSAGCPRCDAPLTHMTAPNGARGHAWAVCRNAACGWSADRDHSAAIRVAARGINRITKGGVGHRRVRVKRVRRSVLTTAGRTTAAPTLARVDRSKTGPTVRTSRRRAGRVATPQQPQAAHRCAGPEPKEASQTDAAQVRVTRSWALHFEGTRWAYRQHLRATPELYVRIRPQVLSPAHSTTLNS